MSWSIMPPRPQLAALSCIALLGACSSHTTQNESENWREESVNGSSISTQQSSVEDWKEARSKILRTFAFRALEQNLVEESRNYLQEACDLNQNDVASHATLARLFLAEDDPRASLAYSERGIEATPGNLDLSLVYAAALAETDHLEEATLELERFTDWETIAENPDLARAMLLHYASSGGMEDAQEFVARMAQILPENPYTYAMLGDLFLASGDVKNAADSYIQALERDPSITTPRIISEELGLRGKLGLDPMVAAAQEAERKLDYPGAERLYRFLVSAHPEQTDAHTGLARVLWQQNRLDEAVAALSHVDENLFGWREQMLAAKIAIGQSRWQDAHTALNLARMERPQLKAAELLLTYVRQQMAR
jgi:tetratricopeptide (TPR) repeat protein